MANHRIFIYPYDQLSEGATAVARALGCQKLLRKNSRYRPQDGDVIVNWGASDCPFPLALNYDTRAATDKREFFKRTQASPNVPRALIVARQPNRLDIVKAALAEYRYPIVCRTKVKGKDGEGIVIAENEDQLVDAPLYVQLENKTSEYRVHMGRDIDGTSVIIGTQQKFLPRIAPAEDENPDWDRRIRTGANGCYFVWTVDGEPVKLPDAVERAVKDVWTYFPEFTFAGLDVIYDLYRDKAFVIEMNTAPEMTEKSAQMYADFFQQFREPVRFKPDYEVDVPGGRKIVHVIDEDDARVWKPHIDYAGEPMNEGEFRDPPVEPEPQAKVYMESDHDYVLRNIDLAVAFLELGNVKRLPFQPWNVDGIDVA